MTAAEPPFVLAIDVGSPANIGWATSSASEGRANFREAVDHIAARLVAEGRAAIGFEAPIWTPRRQELGSSPERGAALKERSGGRGPPPPAHVCSPLDSASCHGRSPASLKPRPGLVRR